MSNPEQYIEEAKKLENSKSVFEFLMKDMTNERYEKISELYEKAGNIYKLSDKNKAIKCFVKAHNYLLETSHIYSMDYQIKKFIIEIAELYLKIDYTKSIEYYEKLINYYTEKGDISIVSKTYEIIGNIYFDNNCIDEAKKILVKTLELTNMTDKSNDVKRRVGDKLGEIIIMFNEKNSSAFLEASKLYFDLAEDYLKTKLGHYSAKKYIFLGMLADMAGGDLVKTQIDLDKFSSLDHTFLSSREGVFISKLIDLVNSNDSEGISELSACFDKVTPFDKIQVNLLLEIKESVNSSLGISGSFTDEVDLS
jgi:tetratricopeptide (TPR) repeat protein